MSILNTKSTGVHTQPINNSSISSTANIDEIPEEFLCPITLDIMKDPVICEDGYTYERVAIMGISNSLSPITRQPINKSNLIPNRALKQFIERFTTGNLTKLIIAEQNNKQDLEQQLRLKEEQRERLRKEEQVTRLKEEQRERARKEEQREIYELECRMRLKEKNIKYSAFCQNVLKEEERKIQEMLLGEPEPMRKARFFGELMRTGKISGVECEIEWQKKITKEKEEKAQRLKEQEEEQRERARKEAWKNKMSKMSKSEKEYYARKGIY